MIHLGIQWPRIRCSRAYAQHQHEGFRAYAQHFQILSFHVFHSFLLNTNVSTHVLQRSSLNTTLITQVLQSSLLNTKHYSPMCSRDPCSTQIITSIMCFKVHAQQKTSHQSCASGSTPNIRSIYISSTIGLHPVYKANHHVHMQWGLRPNIKIKHQHNHHNQ